MNFLFAVFLLLAAFGQIASPMWLKAGSKIFKNTLKVAAKNSLKTVKKTKLGKIIPKKKTRKNIKKAGTLGVSFEGASQLTEIGFNALDISDATKDQISRMNKISHEIITTKKQTEQQA